MNFLPLTLSRAALQSRARSQFRQLALEQLREELAFDAGLYFDASLLPLHQAGCLGVDQDAIERLRGNWRPLASEIQGLRFRALKQGGVTTDNEAFLRNRAGRGRWDELVAGPLSVSSTLLAQLVIEGRLVAVLLLARTAGRAFSTHDRRWLAMLVPVLSACEAVYSSQELASSAWVSTRGRCVDSRLTKRQREVVEQVAQGRTNKEAGQALGISEHTVRNLLVDARARVDAASRTELVHLCQMG